MDAILKAREAGYKPDVPIYLPAGRRLTLYMLESSPVDEQVRMAYDYMLPLVEQIHPHLAKKITRMILEGENNYEIMNMIGDLELLRARVHEMDAILKAREAGYKPDVPIYLPAGRQLTLYMLESAPVDEQVRMAYDYMLPVVEQIHPHLAKKITRMILEGENNYEIMNMIGDLELLRARVHEMDAVLKAREAGYKPEALKMLCNKSKNSKRKKNKKNSHHISL